METTLDRLRTLKVECDALVSQNAFSFQTDIRLNRLGSLARKYIEKETGVSLESIASKKKELYAQISKGKPNEEIMGIFLESEEYKALIKLQAEIWAEVVKSFEFTPVQVSLSEVRKENFEKSVKIDYYGYSHQVNPSVSLQNLINEGFISVPELAE
jgi:hypothetical protein